MARKPTYQIQGILNKCNDGELASLEKQTAKEDPYYLIENGLLKIKTKKAEMLRLIPNGIQRKIIEKIREIQRQGRPVRLWILKARQLGCSTIIEGIIFSFVSLCDNINALVIAHELDGANNLFDMNKVFYDELDKEYSYLLPRLKKSNEKKLEYRDTYSQLLVDTAGNLEVGRSFTFHLVHLSEVAFMDDLPQILTALLNAVPGTKDSVVIGETTANGRNEFYDLWLKAENHETDWDVLFLPWFWHDEYKIPIEGCALTKFIANMSPEDKAYKDKYGLEWVQMNWRRDKIRNTFNGDEYKFRQEYPASASEAFISSSKSAFEARVLDEYYKRINDNYFQGYLKDTGYKAEFIPDKQGAIRIWEHPDKKKRYIIGADCSEGVEGGDYQAAVVFSPSQNKIVATVRILVKPDIFGDLMDINERLEKLGEKL